MSRAPPSTSRGLDSPGGPYKGLVPYNAEDAPFFFGRDEWRDIVIDNVRAYRLTLLYGDSGVGKTSLLHAGVLHALRERARRNLAGQAKPGLAVVVFRTWRDEPLQELVLTLRAALDDMDVERGEEPGAPGPSGDLSAAIEQLARRAGGKVFIVLDQFEEYFLYHPLADGNDTFADALPRAIDRRDLRASFLLSIREDAVAKLDRFKARIPALFDNYLRIEQLDREAARDAIVGPIEEYNRRTGEGVTIAPDLVESVLDEVEAGKVIVGRAGAGIVDGADAAGRMRVEAPYLQLVLTRLWDETRRAGSRELRLETFETLGGAEGIVRTHLDAAMQALPPTDQDMAARLFNYLVTPSGSKIAQDVDDLARYSERTREETVPILDKLSGDVRILRPVGASSYEIYHDALAAPILDWRSRRQEQQRHARERRRMKILGMVALACAIVAAGVTVLALAALRARDEAKRQEAHARQQESLVKQARSRDLAAGALSQLGRAPDRARRAALRAYAIARTPEAEGALRATIAQPTLSAVLPGSGSIRGAAFSPDGSVVATTGTTGLTRVWRTSSGAEVTKLPGRTLARRGHHIIPQSAVFSPAGEVVASPGQDGTTRILDTSNWKQIAALRGHDGPVLSVAFSGDGKRLITVGDDGTTRLWDASTWRRLPIQARLGTSGFSAALSRDGRRAALVQQDSTLRVWDLSGSGSVVALGTPAKPLLRYPWVAHVRVAFSRDARLVLATTPDGWARLWDVARRRVIASARRPRYGTINAADISPDGTLVVTASDDGIAKLYSTVTGRLVGTLDAGREALFTAAFSPDSARVLTGGEEGTVRVWNVATRRTLSVLRLRRSFEPVWAAGFSHDGRQIVATSGFGKARLWDSSGQAPVVAKVAGRGRVTKVEFSPNGALVATTRSGGAIQISRASTGRRVAVLRGHGGEFSMNGKLLVAAGGGKARLWDTSTWDEVAALGSRASRVLTAKLSPDGKLVATTHADGVVRVWHSASGASAGRFRLYQSPGDFPVRFATTDFSSDGKLILAVGDVAQIWRVASRKELLRPSAGEVQGAALSPDGRLAVTAGFGGVEIWTVIGESVRILSKSDAYGRVAFSLDGRLVVASGSRRITTWETSTGRRLAVQRPGEGPVTALDVSPDGRLVVLAHGRSATLGDLRTGQVLAVLPGPAEQAAFSPDGTRIATGGPSGAMRIYTCVACGPIGRLVKLARRSLEPVRTSR